MELELETDPLGLATTVVQVNTKNNVDIISKCAVPKNIVNAFSSTNKMFIEHLVLKAFNHLIASSQHFLKIVLTFQSCLFFQDQVL